jgi:RecB family exonuclease
VLEEAGRDPKSAGEQPGFAPGLNPPLRLSYSRIAAYLQCPRCYYLKHVLGLEDDSGPEQVVGTTVHGALQQYSNELRSAEADGNPLPTRDRLLALGREWFFRAWPRHRETDRVALDQVLSQLGMVHGWMVDPSANIVEVERDVKFNYGPHSFNCRIDRIDLVSAPDGREVFRIVDYKTGQASDRLRTPMSDDLQFGIYSLALDHLYPRAAGDEHTGSAEYWILSTGERGRINLADLKLDRVRARIDEVIAGMLAGHWDPKPKCEGLCRTIPVGLSPEAADTSQPSAPATSGR